MNRLGAWERSLRYLTRSPRTEKQIREYLIKKGYEAPEIDETVERLKLHNYINDRLYAEGFVRSRAQIKLHGKHRLRRDMLKRGVSKQIAGAALDDYFESTDERELLDRAISKWQRIHGKPNDDKSLKRLYNYLFRLGYESALYADKLKEIRENYEKQ